MNKIHHNDEEIHKYKDFVHEYYKFFIKMINHFFQWGVKKFKNRHYVINGFFLFETIARRRQVRQFIDEQN